MESYEIFKNACMIRGRTIADVCQKAGWGGRSSDNWKKGHIPSVSIVLSIAKELNTTVEYLMGEVEDIDAVIASPLDRKAASISMEEKELLSLFQSVSVEGKAAIMTAARAFAGQVDYTKKAASDSGKAI